MSRKEGPKQALFEQLALVARSLGSPARLELLDFLAQGERTVESLSKVSGLSMANTSKHLQQLRQAGLVEARREGVHIHYRMSGDDVLDIIDGLRTLAESRLAEVERLVSSYLKQRDDLEAVAADDLMERTKGGLVSLIDVRPAEEFVQGHLPGAINLPLTDLENQLDNLPHERDVVAYCRGPWCVLAYEAVSLLRKRGYRARRLEGGLPEWRHDGRPIEVEST